jgi:hypothetical protein
MASQPEPDVVALVRKLIDSGKTFSISLEDPDSPAVEIAQKQGHKFDFNLNFEEGRCIEWLQVLGNGLICTKHEGE